MGFWHTGYLDDIDAGPIIWPEPRPKRPICQNCNLTFDSIEDLKRHRLEKHPVNKPILVINDRELQPADSPSIVRNVIERNDVKFYDATGAKINNNKEIDLNKLADTIIEFSEKSDSKLRLVLFNDHSESVFTIEFKIPQIQHIEGVEKKFENLTLRIRNNYQQNINDPEFSQFIREEVDKFADECRQYSTATEYYDGICQYIYGAWAKDRSKASRLKFDYYSDKYRKASSNLKYYDRPISRFITSLVNFHFNHFKEVIADSSASRLQSMAIKIDACLTGNNDKHFEQCHTGIENLVIEKFMADSHTLKILSFLEPQPDAADDILRYLEHEKITDYDRAKFSLLFVELASDQYRPQKQEIIKKLRVKNEFKDWANRQSTKNK